MRVRVFRRRILVDNVYFSSDLHLRHEDIIKKGRKFTDVEQMNKHIIDEINKKVGENDLLVLLGDTIMIEKDYDWVLDQLNCNNIILLIGNHCNDLKIDNLTNPKVIYKGYYCELVINGQIICCSHYPMFHWNYQEVGAFHLHGHLHGDTSRILRRIHRYKSMDVGIDNYYKLYGTYSIFSIQKIHKILKKKSVINRHREKNIFKRCMQWLKKVI